MPVVVKDFTWNETENMVYINVPLKGVPPKKVDIFSTEQYIKVNYPPYIFESFLKDSVYDEKSAAQIAEGMIVFKLEKHEPALWTHLQTEEAVDKAGQAALREKAHLRSQERTEQRRQERSDLKREHGRFGVKQQMALEDKDKQRIADAKKRETDQATEELEEWKRHQQALALQERERRELEAKKETDRKKEEIFEVDRQQAPTREPGKISVKFSHRAFPTPTRESLAHDEEQWLKKQAESRRIIELENSDLSAEERNPVWLRDKGNAFFQSGDYKSAINTYSHAIRLHCKLPSLFSNRAACHLKMGNFMKCSEDCTRALELLTPAVPQNAASRCKAHVRRGTAYCQLELYVEGLLDYEHALKIEPNNEQLSRDADRIRHLIQSSSES